MTAVFPRNHRRRPPGRRWLAVLLVWLMPVAVAMAGDHSTVVTVTAYNSTSAQTQGDPHLAAWGDKLEEGVRAVAVSPDLIPLGLTHGTRVAIAGFKQPFVVLDKTSKNLHRHIDIYMGQNEKKAHDFGSRRLRIWWYTHD